MTRYYVIRHRAEDDTHVVLAANSDQDLHAVIEKLLPILKQEDPQARYVVAREVKTRGIY